MRNFRQLEIWKEAIVVCRIVYQITAALPLDEKFGLKSQMRKCSVSIPSNIAEGCSRKTDKEFSKFLEYSIGSAFELETQFIITQETKMLEKGQVGNILEKITVLQRRMNALRNKLIKPRTTG